MKKNMSMLLAVVMMLALAACGGTANPPSNSVNTSGGADAAKTDDSTVYMMKLANASTETAPFTVGLEKFKELVEEYSDGRIQCDLQINSVLGDERTMVEQTGMGTIECCLVSSGPVTNYLPELAIFDMPYLIYPETLDGAYEALDNGLDDAVLAQFEGKGMISFHFWSNGFRHITNNVSEIIHPSQLKGMKMRSMENDVYMEMYNVLGAIASPMSIGDFQVAVRQGAMDGHDNALANIYQYALYEAQHYISLTYHTWSPACMIFNKDFYESLPADLQEALKKAEYEACQFERDWMEQEEERLIGVMRDEHGVTFSEVDVTEWAEATSSLYDTFSDRLVPELYEAFEALK